MAMSPFLGVFQPIHIFAISPQSFPLEIVVWNAAEQG